MPQYEPLIIWADHRLSDLQAGVQYLQHSWFGEQSPDPSSLTPSVLLTSVFSLFTLQALLILITGVGRKQLLQGIETVIASFLLLCLIGLVLGLPVGGLVQAQARLESMSSHFPAHSGCSRPCRGCLPGVQGSASAVW